ncbi:unnamed protein product [Clonostachys rhizophaga]|uniref:Uncharacterized protein n=1 Tax=Clonostachys rhizophaga TaxID=160324 RepID=A0A9N9VGL7_9HYPO|nr:unnamed protein product [Clonostachys rhizophaga]
MNGYKKDAKLTLEVGLDAVPLVVTINEVKHTEQGPTILDVNSEPSAGAELVPATFKMKIFDRRYAHELRKKLQTGTWNADKDHILLRDAMTGSVDTFLTEWSRDAKIPYSPTSIEATNREAIIWEMMRRQYKSELAMHQALKIKRKKTDPELLETATLRTGTTTDFVLDLMYTSNQYFNVSCLLVREVKGAKPFSSYPTMPLEQDYHLGLSVFNDAGTGYRFRIPEIILTEAEEDGASDSEKTIADDKAITGEATTSDNVGEPKPSKTAGEKGKSATKHLLSPYAPLPMESREITVGTSETFP